MSNPEDKAAKPPPAAPQFGPPTTDNPMWRVVIVTGAVFTVSCLAWITSGFGNPEAPGNQWLGRYGLFLVAGAGLGAIISAVAAMTLDSLQTSRMSVQPQGSNQESEAENGERRL
jgi:hypothetical protein